MVLRLMAVLVRCYPPEFRAEFEAEILGVLTARLSEAGRSRGLLRLLIPIREVLGLLYSLPQRWLAARIYKEPFMTVETIHGPSNGTDPRSHTPGSPAAALLSGLPHLVFGLLIGLMSFFPNVTLPRMSSLFEAILVIAVCGVLFFAWRSGWPVWSASWYLYASWVLLAETSFAIERFTTGDSWQLTSLLLLGWVAAFIMAYFRLYLRDPIKAMLAIAFFFPMFGVLLVEFVPGWITGSLAIGLGLACAAAAAVIVRSGSFGLAWRLMVSINLAAGLLSAYVSEYQATNYRFIDPAFTPSFANFLTALAFYLAFSIGLLFLPMGIWRIGARQASP